MAFVYGVHYKHFLNISGLFDASENLVIPLLFKSDDCGDFLDMGKDLMNPEFGPRYVNYYSLDEYFGYDDDEKGFYFGEMREYTDTYQGRGVKANRFGDFDIHYW